jgi:hypothetical protein
MARQTKQTAERTERFLEALRSGWSITHACQMAGYSRPSVYEWQAKDPAFKETVQDAVEAGTDALVDVAMQRALDGSDALLTLLLKSRRPSAFRERVDKSAAPSGPITVVWSSEGARPDVMDEQE